MIGQRWRIGTAVHFAFRAQGRRELAEHIAAGLPDLPDKPDKHVVPVLNGR